MLKSKSKNVAKDKRPSFFKILRPQLPDDHLRIPPEFRKHISKDLPQRGRLRLPSEGIWSVKYCSVIPPEFRKHISKDLPQRGRLRLPSEGIWSVRVVKKGNEIYLKDGWSEFVQDNSLGNNEFLMFTYRGNLSFNVEIYDVNGVMRVRRSETCISQQPVVQRNDQDLPPKQCQNAAKSFTSEFPFFERCMKSYNVQKNFILNIPKAFALEHFPADKTELVLRNQKGGAWKVTYAPYENAHSFNRGWRAFVSDNKLKEDDICIFELVGKRKLKVYIYRSG